MTAPKKKVAKMTMEKKELRPLVVAYGARAFFVNNGPVFGSLKDLASGLRTMTDAQYRYHTAGGCSDFANWVEGVLLDKECSKALRAAKTKSVAMSAVAKNLEKYRK